MCIDFMLLAMTVSDSCVDHVKKTPKVQAAGNGHINILKLQTSNLTCKTGLSATWCEHNLASLYKLKAQLTTLVHLRL